MRRNAEDRFWHFSPQRGLLGFLAGLVITPIHGFMYFQSWGQFAAITIMGAIALGIVLTFTDKFDV